ncbi:MAG: transketolase C-terminal domain-containing protein, partial [Phototrophicaceae bacterium]
YRHIVFVVADGLVGQMMEPAELPPMRELPTERPDWALTGAKGRDKRLVTSLYLQAEEAETANQVIQERLARIQAAEQRWVEHDTDDAELLVVGFGTAGRIAYTAVETARERGQKVGLLRPQTLWPFPAERLAELAEQVQAMLVVEMNAGQMLDDVRLAVAGRVPVNFYGRMAGVVPMPEEIVDAIDREYQKLPAGAAVE